MNHSINLHPGRLWVIINNLLFRGLLVLRSSISSLLQSTTAFLLQSATGFFYYKVQQMFLQSAIGIAKWDDYYKVRQKILALHLSQLAATVFTSSHDCHFRGSTNKKNLIYFDQNYTANFTAHCNSALRHCAGP